MTTPGDSEYLSNLAAYRQCPKRIYGEDGDDISDRLSKCEPYTYQRLAPGQIRVLRLQPSELLDSPLYGSLEMATLGKATYDAVSYVWGEPHYTEPIFVDGRLLWITARLASALKRMRSASDVRPFWTDSICIDQSDLDEKAAQVMKMARIYREARCVCVHLGDSPSLAADGIELFASLERRIRQKKAANVYHEWNFEENDAMLAESGAEVNGETDCRALIIFLQLPWFSRRWTFQEMVCSNVERPAIFFYHDSVMTWAHIFVCVDTLKNSTLMNDMQTCRALEQLETIKIAFKAINHPESSGNELLQLLNDCHALQCSDARECTYALQSCASDFKGSLAKDADIAKVYEWEADYTQSVETLFRTVAESVICKDRNLDILHCAGAFSPGSSTASASSNQPTWIPAWQVRRGHRSFLNVARFRTGHVSSHQKSPAPRVDGEVLHCQGVLIDCIVKTKASLGAVLEVRYIYEYLRYWGSIIVAQSWFDEEHNNSEEVVTSLRGLLRVCTAQSVFLSMSRGFNEAEVESEEEQAELLAALEVMDDVTFEAFLDIMNSAGQEQNRGTILLASSLCRTMEGRSIFVTAEGRLGIGPASLRIGDEIALLLHARTPFVVRRVPLNVGLENPYKLIGDLFIDGAMYEELHAEFEDNLKEIQLV